MLPARESTDMSQVAAPEAPCPDMVVVVAVVADAPVLDVKADVKAGVKADVTVVAKAATASPAAAAVVTPAAKRPRKSLMPKWLITLEAVVEVKLLQRRPMPMVLPQLPPLPQLLAMTIST